MDSDVVIKIDIIKVFDKSIVLVFNEGLFEADYTYFVICSYFYLSQ